MQNFKWSNWWINHVSSIMSKRHTILPTRTSLHAFFNKQRTFFNSASVLLDFLMNLALVLLKCRSLHMDIILQRLQHFVYSCLYLRQSPFMCYVIHFSLPFSFSSQLVLVIAWLRVQLTINLTSVKLRGIIIFWVLWMREI